MLIKLAENINKILGKSIEPVFEKERVGEVKHSLASIEKAKRILGFKVVCNVNGSLTKLILNSQ